MIIAANSVRQGQYQLLAQIHAQSVPPGNLNLGTLYVEIVGQESTRRRRPTSAHLAESERFPPQKHRPARTAKPENMPAMLTTNAKSALRTRFLRDSLTLVLLALQALTPCQEEVNAMPVFLDNMLIQYSNA